METRTFKGLTSHINIAISGRFRRDALNPFFPAVGL